MRETYKKPINVQMVFCILRNLNDMIFGVLTPLSAVFQLYHGDQF
jgi:hypothetical protein